MKPTIDTPKIKYVKKARMWVKTYFTYDEKNKNKPYTQKQEWSVDRREL